MLGFIARFLNLNRKKAGIQANESVLASDGCMLNLLSVMIDLSSKVLSCFALNTASLISTFILGKIIWLKVY